MRKPNGYSLVEVVVGIGLMSIVTVVTATVMVTLNKSATTQRQDLDAGIDNTIAERIIMGDLRQVSPSYNNILVADDGKRQFFDYEPEVSVLTRPEAERGRELTLTMSGTRSLDFLQHDTTAGEVLIYDPVAAYEVGAAPKDFNTAASLTFKSLNRNNWVGRQRPAMWKEGRLIFLDTPAKIRPISPAGVVDMNVTPKSPVFLGQINEQAAPTPKPAEAFMRRTHPVSGAMIDSIDKFLQDLPSMGGGLPLVRVRGVRWVRYSLEPMPIPEQGARLLRTVYRDGKFVSPLMVADRVASVRFTRKSINDKIIYFKIDRVKPKEKK